MTIDDYNHYKLFESNDKTFIYIYDNHERSIIEWIKVNSLDVIWINKTVPWYPQLLEWYVNRFPYSKEIP